MCKKLREFFKPKQVGTTQDYIAGCDPSELWLKGIMPSRAVEEVMENFDFRSSIHESHYGLIIENEELQGYSYGDANFHLWAIEDYQNAIHYLRIYKNMSPD